MCSRWRPPGGSGHVQRDCLPRTAARSPQSSVKVSGVRAGECGHLLLCPRWVLACGRGGWGLPRSPRLVGTPAAPGRVPVAESSRKNTASGAQRVMRTASRAPPRPGPQPPASPDTQTHDSGWGCGTAPEAADGFSQVTAVASRVHRLIGGSTWPQLPLDSYKKHHYKQS
ncbi:hypothetical protein R6Z07F_002002 [Ovis aries]